MQTDQLLNSDTHRRYFQYALLLSAFTIAANLVEGLVSTYFGFRDETLALFGFGVDSFIEVISAVGIAYMVLRIQRNPNSPRDRFEVTALRVTGSSFYLLTAGLIISVIVNTLQGQRPQTTLWGIVISLISISVMTGLVYLKLKVGRALDSQPIIADANCTKACIYMSIVLLIASLAYEVLHIGFLDSLGALGIAYYAFQEGKEAFEKAAGKETCSCGDECSTH
ncbi:MAG: cation transporter [Anaerolineae bacterium]